MKSISYILFVIKMGVSEEYVISIKTMFIEGAIIDKSKTTLVINLNIMFLYRSIFKRYQEKRSIVPLFSVFYDELYPRGCWSFLPLI